MATLLSRTHSSMLEEVISFLEEHLKIVKSQLDSGPEHEARIFLDRCLGDILQARREITKAGPDGPNFGTLLARIDTIKKSYSIAKEYIDNADLPTVS